MTQPLQGCIEGGGLKVGVVVARFNETITSRLLEGCEAALSQHGVEDADVTVTTVPGSFEVSPVTRSPKPGIALAAPAVSAPAAVLT